MAVARSGRCDSTPAPLTSLWDMKADVLIFCLQIHIQHHTPPSPLHSVFAARQKSDREASQLAPSVPLSSYRSAAECAGLKGCHWWAALCRAEVSMSNRRISRARWFPMDYCCCCALVLLLLLIPFFPERLLFQFQLPDVPSLLSEA